MGIHRRRSGLSLLPLLVLPILALPALPALGQRGVAVERDAVVVERRQFEPRRPPAELPPMGPVADAITEVSFACARSINSTVVSRRRVRSGNAGRRCVAVVRVDGLTVKLDLKVTIWLPVGARRKLVAHEEGHRIIAERIYNEFAEDAARRAAAQWVGRTVTGEAADGPAAVDAALKTANDAFAESYWKDTADLHARVGARYDQLTDHGRRRDVGEAEAIEQAFREEGDRREKIENRE